MAGDVVIYMQPGQRARDLTYKFETDAYNGTDLSVLARHLFDMFEIVDWDYAPSPFTQIWGVRDDGIVVAMTYDREQSVFGWNRVTTKGDFKAVATVQEGDDHFHYAIIERVVGTRTVKYIERLHTRDFDDIQDAFFVDSGLSLDTPIAISGYTNADPCVITTTNAHGLSNNDTVDLSDILVKDVTANDTTRGWVEDTDLVGTGYTVANVTSTTFELQNNAVDVDSTAFPVYFRGGNVREAVTVIGGLWHLEGETVVALANGYVERGLVVTGGKVTLTTAASRVHIGIPYTAEIETLRLDAGAGAESVEGKDKKRSRLSLRLKDTLGLWFGTNRTKMYEAKFGLPELYGQPPAMVTDTKGMTLSPKWDKHGKTVVQQRDPLPATILSITPDHTVGGN